MIAYAIPGEVIAAAFSLNAAIVAALAVSLARTREKVAKLEEWQRVQEKRGRPLA